MKKRQLIVVLITLTIETVLTYLISLKLSIRFIELMFPVGLACSFFIFWFSSSGGLITNFINSKISALTLYIQEREELQFHKGPAFYASLLFLFIGLIFFILLVSGIIPPANK
ncbi:hypothetical protein AT864_02555 [Anoxybacillus sp. P3H1B]|uniref:hypothetical protein n=1 Tax=Anoxybacillaceae TaxID=3120669 RepID=UPI0007912628|nr:MULTISPECIES: hypothetical protein [Anoxybacillus]KXG09090.1 hypothetical protein AT864_02555 [Anoxybacillus sp. P3H1B]MBS2770363.1 hypothetical protein [Anoxybacillus rupiensis]